MTNIASQNNYCDSDRAQQKVATHTMKHLWNRFEAATRWQCKLHRNSEVLSYPGRFVHISGTKQSLQKRTIIASPFPAPKSAFSKLDKGTTGTHSSETLIKSQHLNPQSLITHIPHQVVSFHTRRERKLSQHIRNDGSARWSLVELAYSDPILHLKLCL